MSTSIFVLPADAPSAVDAQTPAPAGPTDGDSGFEAILSGMQEPGVTQALPQDGAALMTLFRDVKQRPADADALAAIELIPELIRQLEGLNLVREDIPAMVGLEQSMGDSGQEPDVLTPFEAPNAPVAVAPASVQRAQSTKVPPDLPITSSGGFQGDGAGRPAEQSEPATVVLPHSDLTPQATLVQQVTLPEINVPAFPEVATEEGEVVLEQVPARQQVAASGEPDADAKAVPLPADHAETPASIATAWAELVRKTDGPPGRQIPKEVLAARGEPRAVVPGRTALESVAPERAAAEPPDVATAYARPAVLGEPEHPGPPFTDEATTASGYTARATQVSADLGRTSVPAGEEALPRPVVPRRGEVKSVVELGSASEPSQRVASPSVPSATPPVDLTRFVDRVVRFVRTVIGREQSSVEMRLHPPELGSVRLSMSVNDGELRLALETTTEVARQVIVENLAQLRETLVQQGYDVDRIDVSLSESFAETQTSHSDPERGHFASGHAGPSSEPGAEPENERPVMFTATSRYLDVLA